MPNNELHTSVNCTFGRLDSFVQVVLIFVLAFQLLIFPKIDAFDWLIVKPIVITGGFCLMSLVILFKKGKIQFSVNAFDFVFLTFILWHFASILWAINPSLIWGTSCAWLFLFGIYKFLSVLPFQNKEFWMRVLLTIISLNCISLAIFFISISLNKTTVGFSYDDLRKVGLFFNINGNYIASMFVMQFPILIYIYLKLVQSRWFKIYFFILFFIHVFSIFMLNSRGASLAFFLQIILFLPSLFNKIGRKHLLRGLGCMLLALVSTVYLIENKTIFFEQYNPLKGIQSNHGDDRLLMWDATIEMNKEYPLLGVGSGNWKIGHQEFGISQYHSYTFDNERFYTHAHNLYMQILGELGWVGLVLFIILFFLLGRNCYYFYRRETGLISKIPFALFISFLVVCCFFGVTYSNNTNIPVPQFIIVAIIFLLQRSVCFKPKNYKLAVVTLTFFFTGVFIFSVYSYKSKNGYLRSLHLEKQGQYEAAIKQIDDIYHPIFYTIENQTILQRNKSRLLLNIAKVKGSILAAEKAVEDAPFYHGSWNTLGRAYMDFEDWNNANICYGNAYELHTNYFNTQLQLAHLSLREKDYDKVNEWLAFYDENILPFLEKYEIREDWQQLPSTRQLHRRYKNYEKQILNIRSKIPANFSNDK